jgi:CelD/BcsL family acetyltransferase involved in cellulose biosynthesis
MTALLPYGLTSRANPQVTLLEPQIRTGNAVERPGDQGAMGSAAVHAPPKVCRVEIFDTLTAAEPAWRWLEEGRSLSTAYQRFDLLAAWQRHVGERTGVKPCIVVAFDAGGQPLFLWPFGRTRKGPLRLIRFLGSKHSNFNVGLWRRDIVASVHKNHIHEVFDRLKDNFDLAVLSNQPLIWDGLANPFALLAHQPSADMSARATLEVAAGPAINHILSVSMRSRLRNKERKLQKLPGYRYVKAASAAEIDRLLDSFFAQKARHMAAQGLADVFAEPGVADFLREACHCTLPDGRPLIEIHALDSAHEVLALFGAIIDDYRSSSMFNTYALGEDARHSPGLILLVHMVNDCAARGVRSFDIGVGRAHYKSFFCPEPEPLFDSFLALTPRARPAAAAYAAFFAAKRIIKHNRLSWAGVQMLRRLRSHS